MGLSYLLLPVLAMVTGGYAASYRDFGGYAVAFVFAAFAAIEWRAYWRYRDNRQSG
jgi:biotin transporter BioY